MKLAELNHLVAGGESTHLEFKRRINFPEKVVKELVAFANTEGGKLLIGVNDDGDLSGLKFPEEDIFALEDAIERLCRPTFDYHIETVEISPAKSIVIYYVPVSEKRPHHVNENGKKITFVRVKDRSIQASRQVREIIQRRRKHKDIQFTYGDKEKLLLDYLVKNEAVTIKEFMELAEINEFQASRAVILLVLANVLDVLPQESADKYILKNK